MTFFSSFDKQHHCWLHHFQKEETHLSLQFLQHVWNLSKSISNPCLKSDFQLVSPRLSHRRSELRWAQRLSGSPQKLALCQARFVWRWVSFNRFFFNVFCLFSKNVYFFSKLRVFFGKSGASDKRMPEMNYQILILVFDFDFGSIDCGVVFLVGQLDQPLPKLSWPGTSPFWRSIGGMLGMGPEVFIIGCREFVVENWGLNRDFFKNKKLQCRYCSSSTCVASSHSNYGDVRFVEIMLTSLNQKIRGFSMQQLAGAVAGTRGENFQWNSGRVFVDV